MRKKNQLIETTIHKLHQLWRLEAGYLIPSNKRQATSIKRQAASLNVEVYNDSDYKATSLKRQALKEIPPN